jgi:outer membrane protein insertion porin family
MLLALLLALVPAPDAPAVVSVRIDAPAEEAARLQRYLQIVPGPPLEPEQVRHAVELIYATGAYADVQVETHPAAGGVEVVFRPRPAPLLGGLRREGPNVLSERALRRASRLREKEALWPERLRRAAADVRVYLVERGWLDAAVEARSEAQDGRYTAVFTLEPGPRVRVRRTLLEGVDPSLRAVLLPALQPRPGQPFAAARAEAARERLRRTLAGRGRWGAQVAVQVRRAPGAAELDVLFTVEKGGRTRAEFTGATLPEGVQPAVLKLLREGGVQADALEQSVERLEDAFLRQGHRQVSVTRRQETRGDEEVVTFAVEPGGAAVVGSVRVAAEEASGLERLLATRVGAPLVERALGEDVRALQRELEQRGYAQATVQLEVPEGGGALPVVFRVREGPPVEVGTVRVQSEVATPEDRAPTELHLRSGQPYRLGDLSRDVSSVLTAFRDGGYPQAEVVPEVTPSADGRRADVVLHVRPGPRVLVDQVVIAGLRRTSETVVRREMLLKEGEPLGLQKVLESQRRLAALGIFERVSVSELDPETPFARSLLVAAQEAPLTTVAYGVGYAERDRVRGSVEVTRRNLFGYDRSLSTFARVSFRGSRLLTTFREPYLLGHHQELFLTGFREEEDRDFFDFVRWGGILQTGRALSAGWSLIVRYTYQQTHSFNIVNPDEVDREFTNSTLSGPSVSVVRDTRDDPLDPHRGVFLSSDLQLSSRLLGGDSFAKGFLQAARYQHLRRGTVLALSSRLGLARTFGNAPSLLLPRPDRFYAGGDYTLRGFKFDAVAPLGGNALLLGGVELRQDVGRFLSTALFTEAGNVFPLVTRLDVDDLRYTAGVGLRYRSALGPLRVDWGFKLDRREGEKLSHLHVTIGHAF